MSDLAVRWRMVQIGSCRALWQQFEHGWVERRGAAVELLEVRGKYGRVLLWRRGARAISLLHLRLHRARGRTKTCTQLLDTCPRDC